MNFLQKNIIYFSAIIIISPLKGITSCLIGFWLSLLTDFPIGASNVRISAIIFFIGYIISKKKG
jgi:ABC-type Mn2+/Zn2+ transport system permease subunit